MQRIRFGKNLGVQTVYNLIVEDNHDYVVFTSRYTPILVENCHAAIISRELGIPCVIGTGDGTSKISSGTQITIAMQQSSPVN